MHGRVGANSLASPGQHNAFCELDRPCSWARFWDLGDIIVRIDIEQQAVTTKHARASKKRREPTTKLLSITEEDGVHRARLLSGNLRSLDTKQLRAEIVGLHTPGNPPVVMFSMRGMDSLASGCLGSFAQLSADLERVGGVLVLYNLPKEIAKVLKKTKLDRIIQTAKSRPQARKKALNTRKKIADPLNFHAA